MMDAISLQDITFGYSSSGNKVLNGIHVKIPAQKVTAILGPNGTGKTTLLHLMLGLLKPDQGQISIKGRHRSQYSRQESARIMGLVPQFESIPFNFTVFEYVLLGRAPYLKPFQIPGRADVRICEEALSALGIRSLREKQVTALSGGERRLVHIARMLSQQPSILLLDEPTAHLDLENQSIILTLLRELAGEGITVVITTHDPNAAIYAADHFVLMNDGQVYKEGSLDTVITSHHLRMLYNAPVRVERTNGQTVVIMDREPE